MTATCPAIADAQFLTSVLAHVDCQAQNLGEGGYLAMSAPGAPGTLLRTGAIAIFVAVIGYRLLLGETPTLRDALLAALKVGIVLALTTSLPAFRALVYDVTMHAPAELAATIGAPAGLPGADGGMAPRLQLIDDQLAELTVIGAGRPSNTDLIVGSTEPLTSAQQAEQQRRLGDLASHARWDPARDLSLLGSARTLFLVTVIGGMAVVRLVSGLLLALTPLFAIFLMFDGTRGLFEGWVRGLVGAALGALAVAIVLGVELALVGPWLGAVMDLRHQEIATPAAPVELLVLALIFALTTVAVLIAAARMAAGFRMPPAWRGWRDAVVDRIGMQDTISRRRANATSADVERSRALAIADAVAASQRREVGLAGVRSRTTPGPPLPAAGAGAGAGAETTVVADSPASSSAPLGQSFRRRVQRRMSAGTARRDVVG